MNKYLITYLYENIEYDTIIHCSDKETARLILNTRFNVTKSGSSNNVEIVDISLIDDDDYNNAMQIIKGGKK